MAGPEFGYVTTWSRRYRCGRKYAFYFFLLSFPYTYFTCAVCQWPNRGQLQSVPMEMRFKNYLDKKYNIFDNADKMFYDTLTSDERLKELRLELDVVEKSMLKRSEDAVIDFTTTGKRKDD